MNSLIRVGVSLCVAVILVGMFALFGVNTYFEKPPINQVVAFRVETATQAELDVVRRIESPEEVRPPEPEPDVFERNRERDGFVQVQFEVTEKGRARDVKIVGAMPAGYYEEQAIRKIEKLRYVPERVDGKAIVSTRSEIVEFKYTPAAVRPVNP